MITSSEKLESFKSLDEVNIGDEIFVSGYPIEYYKDHIRHGLTKFIVIDKDKIRGRMQLKKYGWYYPQSFGKPCFVVKSHNHPLTPIFK